MKTIKSVLVATDLTEMSDEVVRAAGAFAGLADAKLHVLHAFDFQSLPYAEANLPRVTFQGRIDVAERELDEQIRRTVPAAVEVASRDVVIYVAHRAILDSAQAVGADLIVLGPHRKRAVAGFFLGSTADRVIRTATAPCLVVRGRLVRLQRVVVPLDLSRPALGALDAALAWCAALGPSGDDPTVESLLTVLHVIPRVFGVDELTFDRSVIGPELHRQVEAAVARVGAAATLEVKEEVCWGDTPAEEIIRYAERERADLLVLATHGYGAVKRALMGSVASAVARGAPCSVLLVPPALWKTEPTLDLAAMETENAASED